MDPVIKWIVFAMFAERAVEIISDLFPFLSDVKVKGVAEKWINIKLFLALILGLVYSFGSNLSIFEIFNISFNWPYVGETMAALFITAGSKAVHDLVAKVSNTDTTKQPDTEEN